jgi:hypothetical protein
MGAQKMCDPLNKYELNIGGPGMKKRSIWLVLCMFAVLGSAFAEVNVLIVGSSGLVRHNWPNDGSSFQVAFNPNDIQDQLNKILQNSGRGSVNVGLVDRNAEQTQSGISGGCLSTWYDYPLPADVEIDRWKNLRGELNTPWDYIVLIPDPYVMEYAPGYYSLGVKKIMQQVRASTLAKKPEVVLLATWPRSGSNLSVDHYNEVTYRTGRSGGMKVVPAGKAWVAAGAPGSGPYPNVTTMPVSRVDISLMAKGPSCSPSTGIPFFCGAVSQIEYSEKKDSGFQK